MTNHIDSTHYDLFEVGGTGAVRFHLSSKMSLSPITCELLTSKYNDLYTSIRYLHIVNCLLTRFISHVSR